MTGRTASTDDDADRRIVAWLRAGAGGATPCEKVIETSISWLFLFEDRALKLKKPVNFGFVDFSNRARREWAARRETAFNRATAPDLYRGVRAVTAEPGGALALDGPGETVDWLVEMRRFDDDALLSRRLPADGALGEALGREVARVHLAAPRGTAGGGAAGTAYVTASNAEQFQRFAGVLGTDDVGRLIAATDAALGHGRDRLDRRLAQGFCRACHGDLHASNIIVEAGRPILFDGIEFNDRLREIDVLYDLAFLLMDLTFRDSAEAANRALNGWLDAMGREFETDVVDGLAVLALFQSVRAAVRAHVGAREDKADEARRYLAAAVRYLEPRAPGLVAVGGLSGSGKTTHARRLAPDFGAAPGAVVLRSDEIRKRQWRREPLERLPPEAYAPEATARVYEAILRDARAALTAGRSVIADAAFIDPRQREAVASLARACRVPFEGIWLEAPPDILRRLAARRDDASDADAHVLATQETQDPGDIAWRRLVSE
jgi:aminoglycoside phosphotransferase family enzyme/predicted kinase